MRIMSIAAAAVVAAFAAGPASAAQLWGNNAGSGADAINSFDPATGALIHSFTGVEGNGRGVVVVGNVVYYTVVGDGTIHELDATTGLALPGSIATGQSSLSTISFDGTNFWLADYSGTNNAYLISQTGALLKTIHLANATGNTDGLEYFNGKLIANRGDAESIYDIYDLNGNVLTNAFITVPNPSTGIAFDGTNFYTSNVYVSSFDVWNGTTGAFIKTVTEAPGSGYLVEDLSFDFAGRADTCGGPGQPPCSTPPPVGVPEPLTLSIFGAGFAALAVVRRRNKIRNA